MSRLIDADEAYKVLSEYYHQRTEIQHKALREALDRVPTVETIKRGHWEPHPIYPKEWDVCTSCGIGTKRREYGINHDGTEWRSEVSYTYCPWCGARMDGESDE